MDRSIDHADRVQAAADSDAAARSALIASWRRSAALHHLDPSAESAPKRLTEAELGRARERLGRLRSVAQATLDRLYLAVGGVGCCVLLADSDGVPLDRRGAPADDKTFDAWGLWTGAVWSEDSEGTNGIGTCLVEQRPLTVHRDQHFFAKNTLLSCTTAPIHDHLGNLAAALDVSSCRADLTEDFMSLIALSVGDAARRIEAENFRAAYPGARILLADAEERGGHAWLAVDADDLVVGANHAARQAFGLFAAALSRPLPVAELLGHLPQADLLSTAERAAVQRALAAAGGNISRAAALLNVSRATLHRKLNRLGLRRPH